MTLVDYGACVFATTWAIVIGGILVGGWVAR